MEIFLVNLKDKKDRLDAFKNSSINFRLIEAVDTRLPDFDIKPYGLKLQPVDKINDLYFSKGRGALGCYLSHYIFWKYVVSEKIEYALVLEDDAWIPDVENMINQNDVVKKHFLNISEPKLVQLNKRQSKDKLPFWMEGTESYAINYKAAKLLIDYTHDFSDFKNIFIEYAWSWPNLGMSHLELFEKWKNIYKYEKNYYDKNTIRYAVDKFLGYCSHPDLPSNKRLNIEFDPYIGLLENNCEEYLNGDDFHISDVMGSGKRIWEMSYDEIITLEDTMSTYKWWDKKQKEPAYRCQSWCLDHPAKIQEKCTWSTLACAGCDECNSVNKVDDSLWKIKSFDTEPSEESINLCVVLYNEELLINYFIKHYMKLGVTHFTFIDNKSTDKTLEKILEYDNIDSQIFYTTDSYAQNDYGMKWVNDIICSQFKNLWCLVVDIDELFILRNENETLKTLRNKMEATGKNATNCCLIDFYPKDLDSEDTLDKNIYQTETDFLSHSNYYDKFNETDLVIYAGHDGVTAVKGGMRHRVFGTNEGSERVSLTKKSFFKNEMYNTHTLSVGMHWWIPNDFTDWESYDKWDESNKHIKFYNDIIAVGHFKFLKPNIYDFFRERVSRNEDWNGSEEYKKYIKNRNISFFDIKLSKEFVSESYLYEDTIRHFKKKINNDNVVKHNSFANFVYDRYIKEYNEEGISLKICDIGSGNSQDIKFFHDKKNLCYGVDMNGTLNVESVNCKLIKKDAEFVLEKYEMKTLFDVVYMKHLLHEIPYEKSESIFKNAVRNLKINGLLCVEVFSMKEGFKKQSTNDGSNEKSFSNHEMWLYTEDICKKLANDNNCEILYYEEGYFSQNTETQNQSVIRLVCKKRQLPYYTKSENYSRYKQMYESPTRNTIENFKSIYWNLTRFNKLVEKHGIKYTAIGGTLLGLVRHGGIIPWDVDLDLGFIPSEWDKLLAISDVFTELRINIHRHNNNHIHFGQMDCFKLKDKGEYYIGEAKTVCSKEEYENVKKQVFGYSHVYAPLSGNISLEKRYSENYFAKGNVSDHFHIEWQTDLFGEKGDTRFFDLNHDDLSYAIAN